MKESVQKIVVEEKLSKINEHWKPYIIGELNGQHIKLAKLQGEFVWHKHENEDELFYVLSGKFTMEFLTHSVEVKENEILIVPRGVEHRPIAEHEVSVLLFEPVSTLNTGDTLSDFTQVHLETI